MDRNLNEFENSLATALLFVDTILAGDVVSADGQYRQFADSYFSGKNLPAVYHLQEAQAIRDNRNKREPRKEFVASFLERATDDYLKAVNYLTDENLIAFSPLRFQAIQDTLQASQILLSTKIAELGLIDLAGSLALQLLDDTSYEHCFRTVYETEPMLFDVRSDLVKVEELLGALGFSSQKWGGLEQAVSGWRTAFAVIPDHLAREVRNIRRENRKLVYKNVLPHLPDFFDKKGGNRINGLQFLPVKDVWFSGSSNYYGVNHETGKETFAGNFQLNVDRLTPGSKSIYELQLLLLHEDVPGHHLDNLIRHHNFRTGYYGFEETISTMLTPAVGAAEGLGNVAPLLAYGVTHQDELPNKHLQVAYVLARLVDTMKQNACYMVRIQGMTAEEIIPELMKNHLVNKVFATGIAKGWAGDPLVAGAYAPAYALGTEISEAILSEHGVAKGIQILYGVNQNYRNNVKQLRTQFGHLLLPETTHYRKIA